MEKGTVVGNSITNRDDEDLISKLDDLPETDSLEQIKTNKRNSKTVNFANNNQNESNETSFGIEAPRSKTKRYV